MAHEVFHEIIQELNNQHFSRIARQYRLLRTTDIEPILTIKDFLQNERNLNVVDVGCGAGRYDRLLFSALGDNIKLLTCIDLNPHMLEELSDYLTRSGITRFQAYQASAEQLPLLDQSQDVIISFNALHHFKLKEAFQEFSRILRPRGWMFLYTRTPWQNRNSIWGKYFPRFAEKETRLKDLNTLEATINSVPGIELKYMKFFTYHRTDSLSKLVEKARNCHYSTFALYDETDLEQAIKTFKKNILSHFEDPNSISWLDRNVMLIVRKENLRQDEE